MKSQATVTRLLDCRSELGESPVWDGERNRLLWADINGRAINALSMDDGRQERWDMPGRVGCIGRCDSGRLVVGMEDAVWLFDPLTRSLDLVARIAFPNPVSRLNDGKVGPDGAFWVGSMDDRPQKEPVSMLYRVTADGMVEEKVGGLTIANGLAFAPDGRTMYHSDSRGPWIDAWDLDPATGAIANRRRVKTLTNEEGRPDGGACDMNGNYWSCGISARHLNCFAPQGQLLARYEVPTILPTMPCFGGPAMTTIFITSSRENRTPEELAAWPDAGGLFMLEAGVPGVPVSTFRDR